MLRTSFLVRLALSAAASAALSFIPKAVHSQATATASAPAPAPAAAPRWELLVSSGALVPAGAQRAVLRDANLSTAQLSYVVQSRYVVTGMAGWARSRDLATAGRPRLDVFTYDLGAEVRGASRALGASTSLIPFAGAGAGARSYNHRGLDTDATHHLAGYAALGGELSVPRVRVRLEVRDYVTGYTPLVGNGPSSTRNELMAFVGLRFGRRGA